MSSVEVRIKRGSGAEDLPLPSQGTPHSSGVDLRSAEEGILMPGEVRSFGTGLFVEIPPGYEFQVRSRSGLALKNQVMVLNSPGTVDADYRGEIRVILYNAGSQPFEVKRGDRIAQMVLCPVFRPLFLEVEELSETDRSSGGFGSTGVR
ncbi:MAG: dUTP diphosphatase [Thermanaerothrix sp.]|nr:dUTP diphosphatase [Thermanaerothrix sp.]